VAKRHFGSDFPKLHIGVPQRIDSKHFPMSTTGGVEQGVDKGVRILSLGHPTHSAAPCLVNATESLQYDSGGSSEVVIFQARHEADSRWWKGPRRLEVA
jgi:hypothetical protein